MEDPDSPPHCQVSDGGVHSHITHLYALLEAAKEQGIPECYVHFFGDGRDTAPRSANKYAQELLDFMDKLQYGKVATIVGRYYAMDRDKRWERVETAVKGLVNGDGEKVDDVVKAIEKRYEQDETDEFLKPIILGGEASRVKGECGLSAKRCFEDTHAGAWCRERHFILLQLPVGPYAGDC
jgi:2,3-bisphosphoglycerate-independent phosphoglycerate mutase